MSPPLSRSVLGTAQLTDPYGVAGRREPRADASELLTLAWELGVRELDTAPAYGGSEQAIGDWHRANPQQRFRVTTKATGPDADAVRASIATSAERLGCEPADVLLHDPADLDRFAHLADAGVTGVSVYSPDEFARAAALDGMRVIQAPANPLDRRLLPLDITGARVELRSAFLQGLLLADPDRLPDALAFATSDLRGWRRVCDEFGLEPDALAIGFLRAVAPDAHLVIGADDADQLRRNAELLAAGPAPQAAVEAILAMPEPNPRTIDPRSWPKGVHIDG